MKRRKFLINSAAASVAISFSPFLNACSQKVKKPNIVYIFADQWRGTATGYSGNPDIKTPNLDRLARESVNFRNAIAVCPVCTPYRASMQTGRYPTSTGMFLNDLHLPSEELCMAEIFKDAGYNTAYIGKWHLDGHGRQQYIPPERRQGWEYWKVGECDHDNYNSHYYTGESDVKQFWEGYDAFAQTKDAQGYIRDHASDDQPFILMLSFGPPHPLSRPAPEEMRALYSQDDIQPPPNVPEEHQNEARRRLHEYYAHCTALDKCVGDLMKTLKEADIENNTVFIFTSDHGGMLRSHGLPHQWKQVAWNESAHVPFLLRYPAVHGSKGRTVETPLNTPDILPTLLSLADIRIPQTVEGDDLSSLVTNGGEIPEKLALYMSVAPFNYGLGAYRAIRSNRFTYVRNLEGPWLLFDDIKDPYQLENLIDRTDYDAIVMELDTKLQYELQKIGDDFRSPESYIEEWGFEVDPERGSIPYTDYADQGQAPLRKK